MSDFNWTDHADFLICREQRPIAVFTNEDGQVVIHSLGGGVDDADQWVAINPEYVEFLISALQREIM